jgi:hypothetical protein
MANRIAGALSAILALPKIVPERRGANPRTFCLMTRATRTISISPGSPGTRIASAAAPPAPGLRDPACNLSIENLRKNAHG